MEDCLLANPSGSRPHCFSVAGLHQVSTFLGMKSGAVESKSNARPTPARNLELLTLDLQNPTLVSFLDLARWLAAAMVFFGHLRIPLFVRYSEVDESSRNLWIKIWYFVTGLQSEAVIVFFVLSGLLVAGAGAAKLNSEKFNVTGYSVDRISRLYVAFLPALLLGYLLDCYGSNAFRDVGFWDHRQPLIAENVSPGPFDAYLSPLLLLMNGLMLQTFWVQPLGSNHPLWTISTEFWFYVVFGIAAFAWMFRRGRRILALALLVLVFGLLGLKFPVLLGYWLIGMSVALTSRTNWLSPIATVSGFLLLLAVIRLGQFETEGSEPMKVAKNYAVAIAFALVVISFRGKNFRLFELTGNFNRMMAGFSYSLYLIHFPLMLFLLALIHATFGFEGIATGYSPSSPEGLKIYGGLSVMIYVSAWAFSRLTEARTSGVRRRLKTAIGCN